MSLFPVLKEVLAGARMPGIVARIIRIAYFDAALLLIYYFTKLILLNFTLSVPALFLLIATAGTGIGLLFDFLVGKLQKKVDGFARSLRISDSYAQNHGERDCSGS
jgi:hypothetical protein